MRFKSKSTWQNESTKLMRDRLPNLALKRSIQSFDSGLVAELDSHVLDWLCVPLLSRFRCDISFSSEYKSLSEFEFEDEVELENKFNPEAMGMFSLNNAKGIPFVALLLVSPSSSQGFKTFCIDAHGCV